MFYGVFDGFYLKTMLVIVSTNFCDASKFVLIFKIKIFNRNSLSSKHRKSISKVKNEQGFGNLHDSYILFVFFFFMSDLLPA